MTKTNWKKVKEQYVSEFLETGVDVKTFCVRNGLVYSTARKYLNNKLLDDAVKGEQQSEQKSLNTDKTKPKEQNTEQNKDERPKSPGKNNKQDQQGKHQSSGSAKSTKQSNRGGKRPGAGAPIGNQNAFVHGLMTKAFGDLVKYSHQVDDDFKIEILKLAAIKALKHHTEYKDELDEFMKTCPVDSAPTELQMEQLGNLEQRVESSFNQAIKYAEKLERLELMISNRKYTNRSTSKVIAQTTQIEVDTNLKRKGIELASANTEKAKAQTELAKHDLDLKQREGLGDQDDLGMLLDEISSFDDDEILQRFKDAGGELANDD